MEPRGDHLALRPAAGLWREGELPASVLLWLADWEACRAAVAGDGSQIVATRDLRLRVLVPIDDAGTSDAGSSGGAGRGSALVVLARARIVRRSSRATVIEVALHVEGDDRLRAVAVGSYVARAWNGPPAANPQITMTDPAVLARRPPIEEPLAGLLGALPVDGRPGAVRLPADPALQNPQGGLSGPVVALAGAAAVEAALDDRSGSGPRPRIRDLAVAFLAAGHHGPFVATAEPLGAGTYRTEVRDEGSAVLLATGLALVDETRPSRA